MTPLEIIDNIQSLLHELREPLKMRHGDPDCSVEKVNAVIKPLRVELFIQFGKLYSHKHMKVDPELPKITLAMNTSAWDDAIEKARAMIERKVQQMMCGGDSPDFGIKPSSDYAPEAAIQFPINMDGEITYQVDFNLGRCECGAIGYAQYPCPRCGRKIRFIGIAQYR